MFKTFCNSVKTSEIKVRLGRWQWTAETQAPDWEILSKGHLWKTEKGANFKKAFCAERHTVTSVVTTEKNKVAFNVTRQDTGIEKNVLVYKEAGDKIPDTVTGLKIRAAILHATPKPSMELPDQVSFEAERGTPLMIWGRKAPVDRLTVKIKNTFPMKTVVTIALFVRPAKPVLGKQYKFDELKAVIVADEHTILAQVHTNLHF